MRRKSSPAKGPPAVPVCSPSCCTQAANCSGAIGCAIGEGGAGCDAADAGADAATAGAGAWASREEERSSAPAKTAALRLEKSDAMVNARGSAQYRVAPGSTARDCTTMQRIPTPSSTTVSQRPVLLQTISLLPSLERQLAETYEVHRLPAAAAERDAFLSARGAQFDGLVTSAANGADAALIAALPK